MTDEERALKDLIVFLSFGERPRPTLVEDYRARDLVVTTFGGNYGPAGWVIALNGSPPRGLFLVTKEAMSWGEGGSRILWFDGASRPRLLGDRQADVVRRYLRATVEVPQWP